jgi:hypothetical protein
MAGDEARTIRCVSLRLRNRALFDLRILGKISKCGNEGSTICNHDLSTRSRCTNVVGSEVVGQPSHDERTAREDTSSDQESTTILNHVVIAGDEHDVSTHSDCASNQHEGASHTVLVGKICNEKHTTECSDVWRYSQELCVYCLVSQALDDRWQEQRVRVDGRDDGEEVQREEDGVPVQESHTNPTPA